MARRFRGTWTHKVDGKHRVSVPAPIRKVLQSQDPDAASDNDPVNMVIIKGRASLPCLEVYSIEGMDELDDLIARLPRYDKKRIVLSRMLAAEANDVTLDDNGRIDLGQALREASGITDTALFVGMTDRFQIWDPKAFAADQENLRDWAKSDDEDDDLFAMLHEVQSQYAP